VIDASNIMESGRRPAESPAAFAVRLARAKARQVASRHARDLVVGADTIVTVGSRILGKPASEEDARGMLRRLSGRWHEVLTGICLMDASAGRSGSACTRSRVHMRRLSDRDIDWYLQTGEHLDKAGGYAIQGHASLFIDRIEGCYFNVVGFPVFTFARLCRRLGVELHSLRRQS
jgi:septum formation protein